MTYQDPNAKAVPHEPVMDVEVVATDPKTGRATVVRHICRVCGRLIHDWRHV